MAKAKGGKPRVSNFARASHIHVFQSGRAVRVHDSISYMWVMSQSEAQQDALTETLAAAGVDVQPSARSALMAQWAILQELVKEPHVLVPGVDEPLDAESHGTEWCWCNDFTDDELTELIELAAGGVRDIAGFPGVGQPDAGGADSEVLGDDSELHVGVAGRVVAGGDS